MIASGTRTAACSGWATVSALGVEAREVVAAQFGAPCVAAVGPDDAAQFAATAVSFGRVIVLSSCSDILRARLRKRGYTVLETPLTCFQHSGGSACCLTLRLDHESGASPTDVRATKATRRRRLRA